MKFLFKTATLLLLLSAFFFTGCGAIIIPAEAYKEPVGKPNLTLSVDAKIDKLLNLIEFHPTLQVYTVDNTCNITSLGVVEIAHAKQFGQLKLTETKQITLPENQLLLVVVDYFRIEHHGSASFMEPSSTGKHLQDDMLMFVKKGEIHKINASYIEGVFYTELLKVDPATGKTKELEHFPLNKCANFRF
ncbi:MAG: hypothetical protein KU37_05240 [Sulfuricurvum sp. PC08-66]|nr:MAG: hypothetical protein KU37_05240 [Sulfuricurvum sp. PC08-66]